MRKARKRDDDDIPLEELILWQDDLAPEAKVEQFTGPGLLTADWHIPFLSFLWLNRILRDSALGRGVLFIIGDFLDMSGLSRFFEKEKGDWRAINPREEMKFAQCILKLINDYFDQVYWIAGNHDLLLVRKLKNAIDLSDMAAGIFKHFDTRKLRIINQPMAMLDGIRLTHPRIFRTMRLSAPRALCDRYQCDIVSTHGHHAGLTFSGSGLYRLVEPGCICDQARVIWANETRPDTAHPKWVNGYVVYHDGIIEPRFNGYTVFNDKEMPCKNRK